ncbi:MAG: hypothetical protein K5681_06385 [Treponema sp.]|nr:hypothetical protein [Treponema sp.]
MKKHLCSLLLALLCSGFIFAEDPSASVDMDFLSKAKKETYIEDNSAVAWKNYNSGKQIRDMGRRLGAEVRYQAEVNKAEFPFSSGYPDYKYKAARVYPSSKAGADVIYIGKSARVGTFKNLNRVLSGYIERAYGVSMAQADQIAMKVCYWNTNHYNDKAYFKANFNHRVVEVFENRTKTLGLARSYKYWPGNARIVIPFTIVKEIVPEAAEPVAPEPEPVPEPVPEPQPVVESQPEPEPIQPVYVEPEAEAEPEPVTKPAVKEAEPAAKKAGLFASPLIFIIGGAVLLLIIIIIVIIIVNKKKQED